MKLTVTEHPARPAILEVSGAVDLRSSPRLREALLRALDSGRGLVVDLHKVGSIDSSGVSSLLEALIKARDTGLDFTLTRVSADAMRVITLGRLDQVFPIRASVDDALAAAG
ncbi:STAS domain-containing protein [Rhodospirillum rubrum]|uniref:Anti-sigma factor antagonist n=1 Tax=Rhodospirillum rubrum (strain ATCC 11170 / ATH 1.1.1 / DSM 467 / LMG 4362 / NCIMB 8255 / S1) TaxID=269796 RepID=Q2RQ91_RHORT|nr:STAS domain-containing protein [Rhodospirillum rubrum]ABC23704.1 Anti-Sigma-factor antagonist (STAS) domain protein [Rhodospirillum rubrum ATCC 11170]AEO49443.1 anti-sigma-factor antagonist domain-containing protein [Rhodospirillum rubrum F11]MBK5955381.1 anti-sigma factor antagonist [Rhodospirillum rubrum]QXG79660.1 STAS domain-containing protein [Rhodospirillum rubrum]HAP99715.1 anti-sigma factor antagonist [Rhodospirillum rubrum]